MNRKMTWLFLLASVMLLFSCVKDMTTPEQEPVSLGLLKIKFKLNPAEEITPTFQTVIWLEDERSEFITSLLVSDWTAYGGYKFENVCPTWNEKAGWKDVSDEQFDAVTRATPNPFLGADSLTIDCEELGLNPGVYKCRVETHIKKEYNINYTAEIRLGAEPVTKRPEPTYIPEKHEAGDVLYDVVMTYYFE